MMLRVFLWFLLPFIAAAQGSSTGAGFLKLPLSARNAALGEATVADDSHFSSSILNPSLLAPSQDIEFSVAHQEWIQDIQSEFFAVRIPLTDVSIGFSVATTAIDGIEVREIPGPAVGSFTARFAVFAASAAMDFDGMNAGISAKYLYEKIFVNEASGFGFDLGVAVPTPVKGITAAASLVNLGSTQKLRERSSNLPSRFHAGLAHTSDASEFGLRTLGALSYELKAKSLHLHLGAEGTWRGIVALRIGFLSGYESRNISGGIGIMYGSFLFDYGFVPFTLGLGNAHLASVGVRF